MYMKLVNWDYDLPANWQPRTDDEWAWYLVRKLNYNDLSGLNRETLTRYFGLLDRELDPGKRIMLEYYLTGKTP